MSKRSEEQDFRDGYAVRKHEVAHPVETAAIGFLFSPLDALINLVAPPQPESPFERGKKQYDKDRAEVSRDELREETRREVRDELRKRK